MDRSSELLVLAAAVSGLVVVVMIWPRRRAGTHRPPLPHPTTASPVRVRLDSFGDEPHWRVANRHALLDVTIDIVTFRPTGSSVEWVSEPIVEPIRLPPGRSTVLSTVVRDPSATYDVVVAWTTHHLGGGVESTRTFTVGPDALDAVAPVPVVPTASTGSLRVVFGVIAVLLGGLAVVTAARLADGDRTSSADEIRPADVTTTSPAEPTSTTTAATGVPTTTTTTTSTTVPTTTGAPVAAPAGTSIATTSTTTATTTTTTTTTTTSTTTSTVPATSAPVDPRRVTITGRVEDCRFGPDCLIADFTLAGFPREGEYVCEFDDGSRFTFRYVGDGADDACTSSGSSPSITIEVDGVRSATITRDSLPGN